MILLWIGSLVIVGIYLLFRSLVEPWLASRRPVLLQRFPWPIWLVFMGLSCGAILSLAGTMEIIDGRDLRVGIRPLRNGAICTALASIAVLQARSILGSFRHSARVFWVSLLGALGMVIGLLLCGWSFFIFLGSDGIVDWDIVRGGIVGVASGWIGDSSTQLPTLTLIEKVGRADLEVSWFVVLIDSIVGISWVFLMWKLISNSNSTESTEKNKSQKAAPPSPASPLGLGTVLLLGVLGAGALYQVDVSVELDSFWRSITTIGIYVAVFLLGVGLGRSSRINSSKAVTNHSLGLTISGFGLSSGLCLAQINMSVSLTSMAIVLCSTVVGLASQWLFMLIASKRHDTGFRAIASVCAVGGLATAPPTAALYSHEDLTEAAYFAALLCNIVSIPLSLCLWFALPN